MAGQGNTRVVFVGGRMDSQDYDTLKSTQKLYPLESIQSLTEKPVEGIPNFAPVTEDAFFTLIDRHISGLAKGDNLIIYQFGHGGVGPTILLGDDQIKGKKLAELLEKKYTDKENRPFTAIVMGGCYSGGLGKYFLPDHQEGIYKVDFFYGISGSYTIGIKGLKEFIAAGDTNDDGYVTAWEASIYDMNENNPLAVKFKARGSKDIILKKLADARVDEDGNPVLKPYFEKIVHDINNHEDLTREVEDLKFGEQAIVLVEGINSGDNLRAKKWFEKEMLESGGLYKFIVIESNLETRKFFAINGEPAIFVMGPNVRYSGVRLEMDEPIGDQVPKILANENTAFILSGWREKLRTKFTFTVAGTTLLGLHGTSLGTSYHVMMQNNPKFLFDMSKMIAMVASLLRSNDLIKIRKGLDLAREFINTGNMDESSLSPLISALSDLSERILNGQVDPSLELLGHIMEILESIRMLSKHFFRIYIQIGRLGSHLYGGSWTERLSKEGQFQEYIGWVDDPSELEEIKRLGKLDSKDPSLAGKLISRALYAESHIHRRVATSALLKLDFIDYSKETKGSFLKRLENETDVETYLNIIKIISKATWSRSKYAREKKGSFIKQVIDRFEREADINKKARYIPVLTDAISIYEVRELRGDVEDVLRESGAPSFANRSARLFIDAIQKYRDRHKIQVL